MITIAWTALFHAIYYKRRRRPWYRKKTSGTGSGIRYQKIDGEAKHWDLTECVKRYYGGKNPPERKNLEFLLGLRNKIEHRHIPELDPTLYGECQAALLNLEDLLVAEFGERFALAEQLAVSLQLSRTTPAAKKKAAKVLASSSASTVREYVDQFRGGLPSGVLNSMQYSYSVFLVPKVANRATSADAAVEFVHVNEASDEELARLEKLNVLIREKHIPIANLDMYKPGQVVTELESRVPFKINMSTHTAAWKHLSARPAANSSHPENTRAEYCVYDPVHRDYVYTRAWIEMLVRELSDASTFQAITDRRPELK